MFLASILIPQGSVAVPEGGLVRREVGETHREGLAPVGFTHPTRPFSNPSGTDSQLFFSDSRSNRIALSIEGSWLRTGSGAFSSTLE